MMVQPHPSQGKRPGHGQLCVVRVVLVDLVPLDRQNNTRRTQLPGSLSAVHWC